MIHPYDNKTQILWDRGELRVQLMQTGNTRPLGYCDGSTEDEAALRALAESEGAEDVRIEKRTLKTGREIWTLGSSAQ